MLNTADARDGKPLPWTAENEEGAPFSVQVFEAQLLLFNEIFFYSLEIVFSFPDIAIFFCHFNKKLFV